MQKKIASETLKPKWAIVHGPACAIVDYMCQECKKKHEEGIYLSLTHKNHAYIETDGFGNITETGKKQIEAL